jgi:hypothetical protein
MGLRIRDLRVGGRYLHSNGNFVRTIDYIEGNSVYWHDECGPGTGTRNVFLKRCQGFAPDETGSIQTPDQKDSPMTPEEKAQMDELRTAVIALSRDMAAIMELNTTLTRLIVPLAEHLDDGQKQVVLDSVGGLSLSAQSLRETATALSNPPS